MNNHSVVHQVRQFIVANFLFGQGDSLQDNQSFLDGGIIDSTGVLELVSFLEETFQITVEHEELTPDNLDSVNQIDAYLARKLNLGQVEAGTETTTLGKVGGRE